MSGFLDIFLFPEGIFKNEPDQRMKFRKTNKVGKFKVKKVKNKGAVSKNVVRVTSAALACSSVSAALKDTSRALALRGLSINVSKTVAMVIAPHSRACQGLPTGVRLLLQNEEVKLVSQTRLLGIIIDDSLSWSPHVGLNL